MFKKVIAGFLVLATSMLFGMSLSQLNSASEADLMEIKGISKAKATAIVTEREKGEFKSFEDFLRVGDVGAQIVENVKNDVKRASNEKKPKAEKKS